MNASAIISAPEAKTKAPIIAYAPKSATSAHNVMPGHIDAAIPNSMATSPRGAIAHEF
jgi:hypothetical protein